MISAIVLAAGQSKRMGTQKMLLPWGQGTVIAKIITTLLEGGVNDINIVTGGSHAQIVDTLKEFTLTYLYNKDFANGEMLLSVQVGLLGMERETDACLIMLGDQPQIESPIIRSIVNRYNSAHTKVIVPSYQNHRGHPWLVDKSLWKEIINLEPPLTMRDFLNKHNHLIDYIEVDSSSILLDIDNITDYERNKP